MCFCIGFKQKQQVPTVGASEGHVWGYGRQRQHTKMRPAMLAHVLVQADQGCPRLRWAMVDHGSQLASSRRSLCQGQKLSYSCVSLSALDKTASPYCWHVQESCLSVSVFEKQPSCSLPSFWGRGRQRQQHDIAPGYASACWFKQTRGARGCAGPW